MGRGNYVQFRLSEDEKKDVKRRAKRAGCSMSAVVRSAVFSDRDTHIEEFMLQTINRGQLNGSAIMAAERLLRNVRAFEGSVSPEAYHYMEETCLKVIERCTALKRQLRDDIAEYRREIGLPQISRPKHKIRTLEEANLDYWNEVAREEGLEEIHVEDIADGTVDNTKDEIDDMLEFLLDLGEEPEVFTTFDEASESEDGDYPWGDTDEQASSTRRTGVEGEYTEACLTETPEMESCGGAKATDQEGPPGRMQETKKEQGEEDSTASLEDEGGQGDAPEERADEPSTGAEGSGRELHGRGKESARDSPGSTERRDRFEHIRRRWDILGD